MKRRSFVAGAATFVAGAIAGQPALARLSACAPVRRSAIPPVRYIDRWSWAMGQPVRLQLFHESEDAGYELAQAVFTELRRIEARLSRFDDRSDLCALNRQAGRGWVTVGDDLRTVLEAAGLARRLTQGAFDVAVEPLMRTWGFREWRQAAPGAREVAAAQAALAATRVEVAGPRARLTPSVAALDLAGIGVGYGLDQAGVLLRRGGVMAALLDVSGDLLAIGAPPGAAGWPIDIVDPRRAGSILARTRLRDAALATSGVSVSRVRLSGIERGHVLDLARGVPVEQRLQATVTASSGIAADVLSTAVLGSGGSWAGVRQRWVVSNG